MFGLLLGAGCRFGSCLSKAVQTLAATRVLPKAFSLTTTSCVHYSTPLLKLTGSVPPSSFAIPSLLLQSATPSINATRGLTKYSLQSGKRKSVKAVLKKFYRLDWGIWIRTKCGRQRKIYKKSAARRRRARQHVFTNATQSWLLDTMVTRYWRRPRHIPEDRYNPYHKREEFFITRKRPCKSEPTIASPVTRVQDQVAW